MLGIFFDFTFMGWSLPDDKKRKAINSVTDCLNSVEFNLLNMQKMVGRLTDISLMCPFLSGFKRNMLDDLCVLHGASYGKGVISPNTKADLLIWLGFLLDKDIWLPIPSEP